jgi:hypothetical protein
MLLSVSPLVVHPSEATEEFPASLRLRSRYRFVSAFDTTLVRSRHMVPRYRLQSMPLPISDLDCLRFTLHSQALSHHCG